MKVTQTIHTPESRVRIAAHHLAEAKVGLEIQIRDAHKKGTSLRAIAEAAAMSHEQVRRIVAK
jgi:hypothetical protein